MAKEELVKEAEGWLNKWELCNKCENKVNCISNFSYCKKVVLQSYLASAEPREKRITELIALINAERERQEKCDDVHLRKIAELEKENKVLTQNLEDTEIINKALEKENTELKEYNKYLRRKRQGGIQKQYNKVAIIKQQDDQLTKAKTYLKYFIEILKKLGVDKEPLVIEAEQFLKYSEVENDRKRNRTF